MKRIAFILLSFALTSGAMAQTATKKQLQTTIKEKKDEKHEVGSDLKHLKVSAAVKDRKEVRSDRRRIHRKAHHLKKAHGVDHPTIKAQKEVKEAKDQRKGKH
jgi:ribosomal protein S8